MSAEMPNGDPSSAKRCGSPPMSHLNNSIAVKDYSLDELIVADVRSSVYVRPVVEGLYHAFDNVSVVARLTYRTGVRQHAFD